MGMALGGFTAVGAIGGLYAAKRSWDPLPSVTAAGFTEVDLSACKENVLVTEKWRGKPIFILKKSAKMAKHDRDVVVDGARYHVSIGLCTHLGCIPAYKSDEKVFFCACHGGKFDTSGTNLPDLPPPSPLEIPPFKIVGNSLVLGESGPEYQEMLKNNLIA
jgi:ubiquinol-cytochrome c reductase iron-sulfur subunit